MALTNPLASTSQTLPPAPRHFESTSLVELAWSRFVQHRLAVLGAVVLGLVAGVCFIAPLIVPESVASWGSILNRAQGLLVVAPWVAIFPGLLILITVMAINFLGDGLRDGLDPRMRE